MIDDSMFQERVERLKKIQEPECIIDEEEVPEPFNFLRLLTYPFNGPGLSMAGVYVLLPFFVWAVGMILPGPLKIAGFFLFILVSILVTLSTFWYLTVCIRASAEGRTKAPDVFEYSQDDSLWDWLRGFFFIFFIVALCVGPAFAFRAFMEVDRVAFFAILAAGIFFMPMLLLAVTMFDTINALNPILIIASIFSTFFHYCGIVIIFMIPAVLIVGVNVVGFAIHDPLLNLLVKAIQLYLSMMAACLLGRFFYNNEEKLRWDV